MSVVRVIVLHPCTKFQVRGLPFGRYGAFTVSALISLETLTSDLSISISGHGLVMSCASFLPIFSLLCHSILDLGSGTGQTDGQTDDGHQRLMPSSYGSGGTII